MSFDYIEIIKSQDKGKSFCFKYLEKEADYFSGWESYKHKICRDLTVRYHSAYNTLVVKGSLPYFMLGHNFKFSSEDFRNGIEYLSNILGADMLDADANIFEFGTIVQIPFAPQNVFLSHLKVKGMKTSVFNHGKYFEDRALKIKLYDAGRNMKLKLGKNIRNSLALDHGYNPKLNYLKIENYYKKPEIVFKQRGIKVSDLLHEDFRRKCELDLVEKYESIIKSKNTQIINKKQFSSSTIPLILLKEYEHFLPCTAQDLIRTKIKSMSESVLTKEDKKQRLRQMRYNFKKLESLGAVDFDLSALLKKKIYQEN